MMFFRWQAWNASKEPWVIKLLVVSGAKYTSLCARRHMLMTVLRNGQRYRLLVVVSTVRRSRQLVPRWFADVASLAAVNMRLFALHFGEWWIFLDGGSECTCDARLMRRRLLDIGEANMASDSLLVLPRDLGPDSRIGMSSFHDAHLSESTDRRFTSRTELGNSEAATWLSVSSSWP